jgi:predicted transcriptional regulator
MSDANPIVEGLEIMVGRELLRDGAAKAIRERAGLSRGELAQMVETSPVNIWRYEERGRQPRGEVAKRYGRVLRALIEAHAS